MDPATLGPANVDPAYEVLSRDAIRELSEQSPDVWLDGPAQSDLRENFRRSARAHVAVMWRGGPPDHFTASMFVFDASCERICLVLHKKACLWLQPGGHLEVQDVSVAAAATREAQEETGLEDLSIRPGLAHLSHHELNSRFGSCRSHLDLRFAAVAAPGAAPVCSPESDDVRWWPVHRLPTDTDEELRTVIPWVRDQLVAARATR